MGLFLAVATIAMLIVFVMGITGLINPKWVKMPSRGKSSAIFFGAVFILFIIVGYMADSLDKSVKDISTVEPVSASNYKKKTNLNPENIYSQPGEEIDFIIVIEKYVKSFSEAKNELQQAILRDERKQDTAKLVGSMYIKSWIGTINELSTNSEGKAILSVRISPHIEIKTWNNSISDIMSNTLIEKGTLLYKTLTHLSTGQKVKFSGSFFPSADDFIEETSMTIRGSMTNPEFLFKFESIELIK